MISDRQISLYQSIRDGEKPRKMAHWHASSISACPRSQYFSRKGVTRLVEPTGAKILRWASGHHMETAMREHIDKVWGGVTSNVRLTSKKLDLTGEYDNLTKDGKTLIEDKSVHNYAFKEKDGVVGLKLQIGTLPNGNKKWGIKDSPHLSHELQNHAYALLLKEEGTEVENIDYVYMSLDGRIVTYHTEVQHELLENVKQRLEALNEAWEKNEPPVCMCHLTEHPLYNEVMRWCDYKDESTNKCCSLELLEEQDFVHTTAELL